MTAVVIFSGNNDRAVISFCRYATSRSIPFHIIANGPEDYIYHTKYAGKVFAERTKNLLALDDVITSLSELRQLFSYNNLLILPSNEYLNRFLLANKDVLESYQIMTGLCSESVYSTISDKYSFATVCNKYNIKIPQEYSERPTHYPYVIKPKSYAKGGAVLDRPCIAYSESDYTEYLKNKDADDYYYQEFVGGQSIYLLFYIFKNGTYSVYSQENFVQQGNGRSMILCQSTEYHMEKISSVFANLFSDLGFYGLVMVEVKKINDIYFMIEANPRLWGPSQLILDAEMNLFDCFAFENGLISEVPERNYKPGTWYFWSGGLFDINKSSKDITYYQNGEYLIKENRADIQKNDVYKREDTIKIFEKESTI